ncbi:hypothetical protein [Photobacterium leiognathi]|uniref:hypothetical protein n=1 Tax=Photobacterium leiognathi TaxID=553611 RepID=UPI002981D953|nr:hypothetical protein [Photobacterium leiognathi]
MNNSEVKLTCILTMLFVISFVLLFKDQIQIMHLNGFSYWFSSDGGEYMKLYNTYKEHSLYEAFDKLYAIGAPILMLMMFKGSVYPSLIFSSCLFFLSLCLFLLSIEKNRLAFFVLCLLNPFVFLSFFAINKEIYVITSMLFFLSYYNTSKKKFLILCLMSVLFCRIYMFPVFLFLFFIFPINGEIRRKTLISSILFISLAAQVTLNLWGKTGLLDNSGFISVFFSKLINDYLYFIAYIPKYIYLVFMRFLSVIDVGFVGVYKSNLRDMMVSFYTIILILFSILKYFRSNIKCSDTRYLIMAIIAPYPIMFNEILHWRYYIFVLPIYLAYILGVMRNKPIN